MKRFSLFLQFNTHKHTPKKKKRERRALVCIVEWEWTSLSNYHTTPHHHHNNNIFILSSSSSNRGRELSNAHRGGSLPFQRSCCCCCSVYYLTPLPPPTPTPTPTTPTMQVRRSRRLLAPFVCFVSFLIQLRVASCELLSRPLFTSLSTASFRQSNVFLLFSD